MEKTKPKTDIGKFPVRGKGDHRAMPTQIYMLENINSKIKKVSNEIF